MSKRPTLHLIKGGLTPQDRGTYWWRARRAAAPAAENWPRDGEWRRLIDSLMRNPAKTKPSVG